MKSLIGVLAGIAILSLVLSCATMRMESLASGEIRLLSMDVLGAGIEANASFAVNVFLRWPVTQRLKEFVFMSQGRSHTVLRHRTYLM